MSALDAVAVDRRLDTASTARNLGKAEPADLAPFAVEIDGVSKRFPTSTALHAADLHVRRGEFVSLLGPSGCGKTTLLRIIAGLERPSGGSIRIGGTRVDTLPPYLRNVGMVFQQYALFPHKTVAQNIEFGLRFRTKLGKSERNIEIQRALELVRLTGYGGRKPNQLSGGEQQRVAFARAVVTRPDVLLLDEPLSNLDAKLRDEMRVEIKELHRILGITFIYVTHDRHEALAMSDRVVVMRAGAIEQTGTPREVYERPSSLHVARFMGHGNLLPATVVGSAGERVHLRIVNGPPVEARGPDGLLPGARVGLVVRNDSFAIVYGAGSERALYAAVQDTLYNGSFLDVHLRLDDGTSVRAEIPNDDRQELVRGARVPLEIKASGTWILPALPESHSAPC